MPRRGDVNLDEGGRNLDVTQRILRHRSKDRYVDQSKTFLDAQPDFTTFESTIPDGTDLDINEFSDPTMVNGELIDKQPIYVYPDESHHVGDNFEALALKWHKLTGHLSLKTLRKVAAGVKGMEEILKIPLHTKMPKCDSCMRALRKAHPLPKPTFTRATDVGVRLHTNVSGLISTSSIEGGRYFSVAVECCSNYKFVDILKSRDSWLDAIDRIHTRLGYVFKIIRTDNDTVMTGTRAQHYFDVYRIWHKKAPAGSKQHHLNGRSENAIGLIAARGRVMLLESGLPVYMWSFSVLHAADVLNMCLPYRPDATISCYEKLFGKAPDVSNLVPFGCRAYVLLESIQRDNKHFSERRAPGIYLGDARRYGKKGSIVISDNFKKMFISTDVEFREAEFPAKAARVQRRLGANGQGEDDDNDLLRHLTAYKDIQVILQSDPSTDIPQRSDQEITDLRREAQSRPQYMPDVLPVDNRTVPTQPLISPEQPPNNRETSTTVQPQPPPRPVQPAPPVQRVVNPLPQPSPYVQPMMHPYWMQPMPHIQHAPYQQPFFQAPPVVNFARTHTMSLNDAYGNYVKAAQTYLNLTEHSARYLATTLLMHAEEPRDFFEACSRRDCDNWIEGTYAELQNFIDFDVWEPVEAPPDAHIIGSRIVYKLKLNENNQPIQWKARIVIQGYNMIEGLEYFHSFAAMAHPVTIRILIAAAVANKWDLTHIDISAAFLHSEVNERIYVNMPKGFERPDGKVMALKKACYGTKSAGNYWFKTFAKALKAYSFKSVFDDDTLMIIRKGDSILAIATVVDDCILASNDTELRQHFMSHITVVFPVKDIGILNWFLGIHYRYLRDGSILACQKAYIEKYLDKLGLANVKLRKTPMDLKFKVYESDLDKNPSPELVHSYREKIGGLIWLQTWTRPDIAYHVNFLARFTLCCTPKLMAQVDWVWGYLRFTAELGVRFTPDPDMDYGLNTLIVYSDASDADCLITRRSTGGHVMFYNSSPFAWRSKRHTLVGLNTMDSEAYEICAATQQIKHVAQILEGLDFPQQHVPLLVDNQAAIQTAENPCLQHHTKHLGRRYGFIREAREDGEILLVHTPGKVNIADIFTKVLPYAHYVYLRTMLLNCRASDVMDNYDDTDFMITEEMDDDDDDTRFSEVTD